MDLDEFAADKGYRPTPTKVPVSERITPALKAIIVAGRAKGYSWSFISDRLLAEHAITISPTTIAAYITGENPETR